MRPTIALTALLLTLPLAGCDFLDRAEGRSPNREYMERLAALEARFAVRNDPAPVVAPTPAAPPAAPPPVVVAQPVVVPPPPAPVVVPPEPAAPAVCVAIFRVLSCGDNGEWIWL